MTSYTVSRKTDRRSSLNATPLDIENLPSRILNGDCNVLPPKFSPPKYISMLPFPSCGPCGVPPPCAPYPPCFFPPPCTSCPCPWMCPPFPPCLPPQCSPPPNPCCPPPGDRCCPPKPCCCPPPGDRCCPPKPCCCPPPPPKCCPKCPPPKCCNGGMKQIICIPKPASRKTGNGESTSRADKSKNSAPNPSFDQPASYNNCNFYLTTIPKGLQEKFGMMMGQGSIVSEGDYADEISVDDECGEPNEDDEDCVEDIFNSSGGDDRIFNPPVGYPNSNRTPWATGGLDGETNSGDRGGSSNSGGRGGSSNSGGGIRGGRGSSKSASSNSRNARRNVIPDDCDDQQYTGAGTARGGYNNSGGGYNNSGGGYNNSGGEYNNSGGGYNNSGGGYNNSGGGFNNAGRGFNNSRGGFNNSRGGYNNSGGGYNNSGGSYNNTSGNPNKDVIWGDDPCLSGKVYRNPENYRDYLYDDQELTAKPDAYLPQNYPVPPPHTFNKNIHPLRAPVLPPSGMATTANRQQGNQNYSRGAPRPAAYDNCVEETGAQYGQPGTRAPQTSANYPTYYGGQYDDNCAEIPQNARSNYVKRGYSAPDLSQNEDCEEVQQVFKANTFAHLPTQTVGAFNPEEDCVDVDAAECEELITFKNDTMTGGKTRKKRNKKFCIRPHARRLRRLCSISNRRSQRLSDVHKPTLNMAPPPCPIRETVASILKKKPPIDCRWHEKDIPPFHEFCMTDHCPDTNRYPLLTRMDCDGLPTTYDADRFRQVEKRGTKRRNHHRY